jgi:hypothetical protein
LGEWHWDEPEQMWIFDEYPPLAANAFGELPQTGATLPKETGAVPFVILLAALTLLGAGFAGLKKQI